jgi:hypothetical protein
LALTRHTVPASLVTHLFLGISQRILQAGISPIGVVSSVLPLFNTFSHLSNGGEGRLSIVLSSLLPLQFFFLSETGIPGELDMAYRIFIVVLSLLAIGNSLPHLRKRDADFESVRTRLSKSKSGRPGDPVDKYFHEAVVCSP